MDLARMLTKCVRDQWKAADLDFTRAPRRFGKEDEIAICQYFTNMAGIERLAGALFREQRLRSTDPTLQQIFRTFEVDELRHSHVAQLLADHYNVHHYRYYQPDPHLVKFAPAFVHAIRYLSPEVANTYITCGEIILDVALLRSLNDYVDDDLSHEAMELINRDESRHIAVDFHMIDYYSSDEYLEDVKRLPKLSLKERSEGWLALGKMLFHARPFLKAVFFEPMDLVDPSGHRLKEAFKRIQLVGTKPRVQKRPFVRFMKAMQDLFNRPLTGMVFGRALIRIVGVDPRVMRILYDEEERARAEAASFEALAEETLQLKYQVA
jgi:hypothetical protein